MSGDNEPLIPRREDPILPLTNRRAPLLERIRDRRNKRNNLGAQVASKISELALFSSDEERMEEARTIRENFVSTLSQELGVPEEAINPELADEFTAMFVSLEETDIVIEEVLKDEPEDEEQPAEEGDDEEDDDDEDEGLTFD